MSRVHPPGKPCGSVFCTPLAANLPGGAQLWSLGMTKSLIENGALEVKWLSNATPRAVWAVHAGVCSPACDESSSHLTTWLVVARLASFCRVQVIGAPYWSTCVV